MGAIQLLFYVKSLLFCVEKVFFPGGKYLFAGKWSGYESESNRGERYATYLVSRKVPIS